MTGSTQRPLSPAEIGARHHERVAARLDAAGVELVMPDVDINDGVRVRFGRATVVLADHESLSVAEQLSRWRRILRDLDSQLKAAIRTEARS